MKARKLLWLVALVAAGGVAFLALLGPSSPTQVVTLSDGTRLTVLRVTLSRHPTFCVGNPLQKIGASLPGKVGEKLSGGTRFVAGHFTSPVLAIWFTSESTTNWWSTARIPGEDGVTWMATQGVQKWALASNQELNCIIADAWPRREKEVKVQLRGSGETLVTFRIPNPSIQSCEQWNPELLPSIRRVGDAEFALQAVEVESYPAFSRSHYSYDNKGSQMATLYLLLSERGQSSRSWEPASITMQDATGNSIPCIDWNPPARASSPLFPPNTIAWSGDWPAVPGENAVKVVVEFVRQTLSRSADGSTNAPQRQVKLEWIVPAGGTVTNIAGK
jgi:hypothetical protein